jgi:hypothetical protein
MNPKFTQWLEQQDYNWNWRDEGNRACIDCFKINNDPSIVNWTWGNVIKYYEP